MLYMLYAIYVICYICYKFYSYVLRSDFFVSIKMMSKKIELKGTKLKKKMSDEKINPYSQIDIEGGQVVSPVPLSSPDIEEKTEENIHQFAPPSNPMSEPVFIDSNIPNNQIGVPQQQANAYMQNQPQYPNVQEDTKNETQQENQANQPLNLTNSAPTYDIYSKLPLNITPIDWMGIPNDPANYVRYWSSAESFNMYNTNSREQTKKNSPFWAIGFLVNIFIGFVLMCCCTHNAKYCSKDGTDSSLSMSIFVTFLVCLAALAFYIITHIFFPKFFIKYGILTSLSFQFLCAFLLMIWSIFYYTGIFITFAFLCIFGFFYSRGKDDFNIKIFNLLNTIVFKKKVVVLFNAIVLFFMSFVGVFAMYTSFGAFASNWDNFSQFYLVLSLWYTVNTLGNCFYMVAASLLAKQYFTPNPLVFDDLKFAIKRAFIHNLGTASKAALILPLTEVFHFLATLEPESLASDLLDQYPTIVKVMREVTSLLKKVGLFISKPLDKLFTYPSRRALAYCAMFGIDWRDACLRYAEVCSKRHSHLAELQYTGDTIWLFRCFILEVLLYFICYVFGPIAYAPGIGAGRGFFLSFIFFYSLRSILRGTAETLFVCFGEDPTKADLVSDGLTKDLSDAFVAADRARSGGMSVESLLISTNPYQTN